MSLLAFFLLQIPSAINDQDIRKLLEFQYEAKISSFQAQIESLETRLTQSQTQLKSCFENSETLKRNLIEANNEMQRLVVAKKEAAQAPSSSQEAEWQNEVTAESLYREAQIHVGLNQWSEAILRFEEVVKRFPQSELADNALYWMAKIYLSRKEKKLAEAELLRLLELYPKGDRAFMAKEALVKIEDSNQSKNP